MYIYCRATVKHRNRQINKNSFYCSIISPYVWAIFHPKTKSLSRLFPEIFGFL